MNNLRQTDGLEWHHPIANGPISSFLGSSPDLRSFNSYPNRAIFPFSPFYALNKDSTFIDPIAPASTLAWYSPLDPPRHGVMVIRHEFRAGAEVLDLDHGEDAS
ncbi:hypothetical protein DXG01_003728 [Tephrocybe rancida]|nr:hypothetical protein DXG01_003728 [Tephrocybe rancida]